MADDPSEILRRLSETYRSVRLGRGVVGKTGQAMLALLGIWGVVAWQLSDSLIRDLSLIASGLIATSIFVWWTQSTQNYAKANPAEALLEGAELLEYQRFEAQTKGNPSLASSPRITDPVQPPPDTTKLPIRAIEHE